MQLYSMHQQNRPVETGRGRIKNQINQIKLLYIFLYRARLPLL